MKNVIDAICARVFSFGGFVTVAAGLFVLIMSNIATKEKAENDLAKATTKACYDGGMIKVDTDAGAYCVVPANLVKVKS